VTFEKGFLESLKVTSKSMPIQLTMIAIAIINYLSSV